MPPKKAVAGAQPAEVKGKCVLCAVAAERICQRCGDFYCSRDCQLQDWPRHRYICFPLPALVYPRAHSVLQSSEELSLEGACSANSDKSVVGAAPAPSAGLLPDLEGHKTCSSSNIAPQNKPAMLPNPPMQLISHNSGNKGKNKNVSPPNAILPPSNSRVYVMTFKSANRCYIRDASEVADRAFAQVCEKVNIMGNELPRMVKPRPFGFCLARHNGIFQRARVMNVFGNHSARLQLLDHGVVKSRTMSDMREISDELLALPRFILEVQLKDVANYAVSDDFFAFTSQFEGEVYVAVHEKTPGCIQVELLHPETKVSLNAKIREFCANKKIYENMNDYKKKEKPNQQNPPTDQLTTKDNNSQAVPQAPEIKPQDLLKKLDTEGENQSNPRDVLTLTTKNSETPKQQSPPTGQEPITQNQSKSEVSNNTPAKAVEPQKSLKNKEGEVNIQIDQATVAGAQENLKKDQPNDLFGDFFRSYVNKKGISEQDLKKMSPNEIFSEFLRSHANSKDKKDNTAMDLPKDVSLDQENIIVKKPAVEESKQTELKVNLYAISNTSVGPTTKDAESSRLESRESPDNTPEEPRKNEKPTPDDQDIKTAVVSKPKDEELREFLTQCLGPKVSPPTENTKGDPSELPKLKGLLDSLSISKASPQANGIVKPHEALLTPPFELRRFSIQGKEGIDVFVVDSSKKHRGIFGAFDSAYACEYSTLHSRLSDITDSEPYRPQLKEYILARFEGSWYRGRVEQIITTPQKPAKYRVMYLDYTNVEDITEMDIRRYPLDFTTPCTTNLCVIDEFPHKPNAAQISFLSDALKVHNLIHVDSVTYLNNVAIVKSRSLIQKLMSL
ncbi:uncharacterized protein LOC108031737 isoform X2 [Drosophila biarmipes]|uniref:uncharacterized protein LOC108031737 isoform X2 n=1 Tax=Drosophila biarmipes TaxID=125945 RepID=UPI0007E6E612|nr:uncharacterized protein LOC108031737 isoform X2 [Drosophila biarmipes]